MQLGHSWRSKVTFENEISSNLVSLKVWVQKMTQGPWLKGGGLEDFGGQTADLPFAKVIESDHGIHCMPILGVFDEFSSSHNLLRSGSFIDKQDRGGPERFFFYHSFFRVTRIALTSK